MTLPKLAAAALATALLWPSPARAQTPANVDTFMVLNARAAALGGAWVTGRDQDVVFTNAAQVIGARNDAAVTLFRSGETGRGGAFGSTYSGGKWSFALGWGLQGDDRNAAAALAGAVQIKGFKIGTAARYATTRDSAHERAWLVDVGVARALFGGTAGVTMRNLDIATTDRWDAGRFRRKVVAGYSIAKPMGPLDMAAFGEVGRQTGFTAAAAGVEAGYSWIEGLSVQLRAGWRRAETRDERPMTLGAGFSADRLTIDYALRLYTGSRTAHVVTLRWR